MCYDILSNENNYMVLTKDFTQEYLSKLKHNLTDGLRKKILSKRNLLILWIITLCSPPSMPCPRYISIKQRHSVIQLCLKTNILQKNLGSKLTLYLMFTDYLPILKIPETLLESRKGGFVAGQSECKGTLQQYWTWTRCENLQVLLKYSWDCVPTTHPVHFTISFWILQ